MPELPPLPLDPTPSASPELARDLDAPSTPAPAPDAASDQHAKQSASASAEHRSEGWFAFSGSGRVGEMFYTNNASYSGNVWSNTIDVTGGLHAVAAAHVAGVYGGMSLSYDQSLSDSTGTTVRSWRPGVVLGWGAPYADGWCGLSATGGGAFYLRSGDEQQWFAELAAHARLPDVFGQKPFVSAFGGYLTGGSMWSSKSMFGLELGLVWKD
jgi:hypothetical protein